MCMYKSKTYTNILRRWASHSMICLWVQGNAIAHKWFNYQSLGMFEIKKKKISLKHWNFAKSSEFHGWFCPISFQTWSHKKSGRAHPANDRVTALGWCLLGVQFSVGYNLLCALEYKLCRINGLRRKDYPCSPGSSLISALVSSSSCLKWNHFPLLP